MDINFMEPTLPQAKTISCSCRYEIAPIPAAPTKNPYDEVIGKISDSYTRELSIAKQQKRTTERKAAFLIAYEKRLGNIFRACQDSDIKSRKTIYNWIKTDPDFKKAMDLTLEMRHDYINDLLLMKIFNKHDGPSIRWYLSHKHPDFMMKRHTMPLWNTRFQKVPRDTEPKEPSDEHIEIRVVATDEEVEKYWTEEEKRERREGNKSV
jgi:hypothetical protein